MIKPTFFKTLTSENGTNLLICSRSRLKSNRLVNTRNTGNSFLKLFSSMENISGKMKYYLWLWRQIVWYKESLCSQSIKYQPSCQVKAVLRSQNYLFWAPTPAPPLSHISAPAPAIKCHLILNKSRTIPVAVENAFFFILASSKVQTSCFIKIISAPAPDLK